jgi:dynein heavy chain
MLNTFGSHHHQAHPSFYESVAGGLPEVRSRIEALQRKFNEESKVG